MVERQIVALDAVGSNPTILPFYMPVDPAGTFCISTEGCRQAVRHRTLTPALAGSNPATPGHGKSRLFGAFLLFWQGRTPAGFG